MNSSWIASIFRTNDGTVVLDTSNVSCYAYYGINDDDYTQFEQATSKGKFFHQHKYLFSKFCKLS